MCIRDSLSDELTALQRSIDDYSRIGGEMPSFVSEEHYQHLCRLIACRLELLGSVCKPARGIVLAHLSLRRCDAARSICNALSLRSAGAVGDSVSAREGRKQKKKTSARKVAHTVHRSRGDERRCTQEFLPSSVPIAAVSYTHLDVYKRQGLCNC